MQHRAGLRRLAMLRLAAAFGVLAAAVAGLGERACGGEGMGVVKGVVVDEEGKPVAGARVRAIRVSSDGPVDPFSPALDMVTDANGRFEARLRPGRYVASATRGALLPEDKSWRATVWEVEPFQTLGDVQFKLTRGCRVEGVVVRKADGQPVPSAKIATQTSQVATSDAQGRFVLEAVSRGKVSFTVVAPGLANESVELNATGKEAVEVRVAMKPGYCIRGRVSDAEGRPIAGALVSDHGARRAWTRRVVTDGNGRYDLAGYAFGGNRLHFRVSHPVFAEAEKDGIRPLEKGEALVVDFVLAKGLAIEGDVAGPDGRPLAGAQVTCTSFKGSGGVLQSGDTRRAWSDANGRFGFGGMIEGQSLDLVVWLKGYGAVRQYAGLRRGEPAPQLHFGLKPARTAQGRVVDRHGRPVPAVHLLVLPADGGA